MKLPILLSFAHHSPETLINFIRTSEYDIFLDSGAYTNFTTGMKEGKSINDYIYFLKNNKNYLWNYINYDCIGDEKETQYNYELMKVNGLNPMPVFQKGYDKPSEKFIRLKKMIKENEFFGIGGVAGKARYEQVYINSILKKSKIINKKSKCHLLGNNWFSMLKYLPYSSDCSNIVTAPRYGYCELWYFGKMHIISHYKNKSRTIAKNAEKVLSAYNIPRKVLEDQKYFSWKENEHNLISASIQAYIRFSKFIFCKYKRKYFLSYYFNNGLTKQRFKEAWDKEKIKWKN